MIAERSLDEQGGAPPQASHLKVALEADTTARLENEDGKSLQFVCKAGAQAMTATVIDRVAFYPEGKYCAGEPHVRLNPAALETWCRTVVWFRGGMVR
jgi:hypothetical protein